MTSIWLSMDDPIKLGRDRVQQMAVGHPAISADFFDVMDLDPRTGVVLRISGRPAVCDLVLFRASKRRERACCSREPALRAPTDRAGTC